MKAWLTASGIVLASVCAPAPLGEAALREALELARLKDELRTQRRNAADLLRSLARVYEGMEAIEDALDCAQRVVALNGRRESDALHVALLHSKLGAPEDGVTALLAFARTRRPSVRLCRAIGALAEEAGNEELAARWVGRATAKGYGTLDEHYAASGWLHAAGFMDARADERALIFGLRQPAHQTAMMHYAFGKELAAAERWQEAGEHYIKAAHMRSETRHGTLDTSTRRWGATGYALRSLAKVAAGDDAGSRRDMQVAVRWAGGTGYGRNYLVRALRLAPPTPWYLDAVRDIAEDEGWAQTSVYAKDVCETASRWIAYQKSLPGVIKPCRAPEREALLQLLAPVTTALWVEQDPVEGGWRWLGTETHFVMLDDTAAWRVQCWPGEVEALGVATLRSQCIAFTPRAVWVGTDRGLFTFSRKRKRWLQRTIGPELTDVNVAKLQVTDGQLLATVNDGDRKTAWTFDLERQTWARPHAGKTRHDRESTRSETDGLNAGR